MSTLNSNKYLAQEKITRLMVKFSLLCMVSLLIGALYNLVDQIFIGNSELSTLGNAATGVVFPIFILAQACAWCISNGCATYLNLCQGRQNWTTIPKAVGTCSTLTLVISLLFMLLIHPYRSFLLTLFGASPNNLAYALSYLNIVLLFFPALMFSNMSTSILGAEGSPEASMWALLAGALTNIILDPLFIFVFHLGMTGAALATGLRQLASCIIIILYHPRTFKLQPTDFYPDWQILGNVLQLGLPTFVTQLTLLLVTVITNYALVYHGNLS